MNSIFGIESMLQATPKVARKREQDNLVFALRAKSEQANSQLEDSPMVWPSPTSSNGLKSLLPKDQGVKPSRPVDQILRDNGRSGCARLVCFDRRKPTSSHGLKAQQHIAQGFSPWNRIAYIAACRVARTHFATDFLATLQAAFRINRTPGAEAPGYVRLGLQPIISATLTRILLPFHPAHWAFNPFRQ